MKPLLVFVVMAVLIGTGTGWSQTKASEKEWAAVIEAAKKEAKVVVFGSPDPVMRNEVIPKFTARYGIAIEFIAGRASQFVSRIETERALQKQDDRSIEAAPRYARGGRRL
jgi:hypothetical protein